MEVHYFNRKLLRIIPPIFERVLKRLPTRDAVAIRERMSLVGRLDYEKADIYLGIESLIEYDIRLHSCKKEPETVAWLESFKAGEVFYDVGANVGAYSLVAAKGLGSSTKVFAFEPAAGNYARLCMNIALNKCGQRVVALPIALSNKTTMETFNYSTLTPGGALHALGQSVDYKGDVFQPYFVQEVLAYRLDDLVMQFGIPLPNHIKIDVDGIESAILEGARKILAGPEMKSLLLELEEGSDSSVDTVQSLEKLGYQVAARYKYRADGGSGPFSKMSNYIFVKENPIK